MNLLRLPPDQPSSVWRRFTVDRNGFAALPTPHRVGPVRRHPGHVLGNLELRTGRVAAMSGRLCGSSHAQPHDLKLMTMNVFGTAAPLIPNTWKYLQPAGEFDALTTE